MRDLANNRMTALLGLALALSLLYPLNMIAASRQSLFPIKTAAPAETAKETKQVKAAKAAYLKMPIYFAPNKGQMDKKVKYYAQGAGYNFYLTDKGVTYSFSKDARKKGPGGYALKVRFPGSDTNVKPTGVMRQRGRLNYLKGRQADWKTHIPTYGAVIYKDLYPGIDLGYAGNQEKIKYEFTVAPRADYRRIRLAYSGAQSLTVDKLGNLVIGTPLGGLKDEKPVAYQQRGDVRVPVPARFTVRGSVVGFSLGDYDRNFPVVIDPQLSYSTYLGGGQIDWATDIAVDASGNAYVTGFAFSPNFPTSAGAFDRKWELQEMSGTDAIGVDAFVTKINPKGTRVIYSTFLGGTKGERAEAIRVDDSGRAYVAGNTDSSNFPTTAGAFDRTLGGDLDIFVAKLNASGTALVYSTLMGSNMPASPDGLGHEQVGDMALDKAGRVYVTGMTQYSGFPVTSGAIYKTGERKGSDPFYTFVAKLNAAGSGFAYSTYLPAGGSAIAVDDSGNAYVAGSGPADPTPGGFVAGAGSAGAYGAYITKINAAGTKRLYSSNFAGMAGVKGVAIDGDGNAYITGNTNDFSFPTTPGAFDTSFSYNSGGYGIDAFVTKINAAGSALVYSTLLGSNPSGDAMVEDTGYDIAVDTEGFAYVVGEAGPLFPTTTGAFDRTIGGSSDAFLVKLNRFGTGLKYSTYVGGGPGGETAMGLALGGGGRVYVCGFTSAENFPTTAGVIDRSYNGGDGFVVKFDLGIVTNVLAPRWSTNRSKTTDFSVSWNAQNLASSSPIGSYDVQYKLGAGGAWTNWKAATADKSAVFKGSGGRTYYFRARARDRSGTVGSWSVSVPVSVPQDQRVFDLSGGWSRSLHANLYKATSARSAKKGAKAKTSFSGARAIALIVTKSPSGGYANVFIGSTKIKTINLYSSSVKYRVPILIKSSSTSFSGTLKVVVKGAHQSGSKGNRVEIDGLGIRK